MSSKHTFGADAATLASLAALPPLEYDRVRQVEAARLKIRVGTLDDQVLAARKAAGSSLRDHEGSSPDYSDDAVALEFASENEARLLFVSALGGWLHFDGRKWVRDETLRVMDEVRAHCRQAAISAQRCLCDNDRTAISLVSGARITAIEKLTRCDRRLARSSQDFDTDPWALNTPDGVVDLRTNIMRQHSSTDLFTKVTTVSPKGACPKWLRFLLQITQGDKAYVRYLQRLVGYTLTGCVSEHAFMFLWGPGGNGKSVFLGTIASILGDYATTAMADVFTVSRNEQHPTHVASLRGARMVVVTETEEGKAWAEVLVKSLTGGDRVSARVMRADPFEFSPMLKLWIAGNHRPGLRNPGPSMRRRLKLLPLTYVPPRPDRGLAEALIPELPGILAWALVGCRDWQEQGLNPPHIVEDATSEYFADQDNVANWIEDRCEIDGYATTPSRRAYSDWKTWAEERGEDPGTEKRFSAELERRFAKRRTRTGREFLGFKLRPSEAGVW